MTGRTPEDMAKELENSDVEVGGQMAENLMDAEGLAGSQQISETLDGTGTGDNRLAGIGQELLDRAGDDYISWADAGIEPPAGSDPDDYVTGSEVAVVEGVDLRKLPQGHPLHGIDGDDFLTVAQVRAAARYQQPQGSYNLNRMDDYIREVNGDGPNRAA